MTKTVPTKTVKQRIEDADRKGNDWLFRANEYRSAGKFEKAERCYEKGNRWLDVSNKLRGALT